MAFPDHVNYLVISAGIHGLSTAWRLAERLIERDSGVDGRIVVLDRSGIASGASDIACGVVRNNYFQPAMRNLMAHSVDVWESDLGAFSYHPFGYMQISCDAMRNDVAQIYSEQQATCYESEFIEGSQACTHYMRGLFDDWQAQGITSVLHEKRGGYANNTTAIYGLAKKAEDLGVRILTGVEVKDFTSENGSGAISHVETDRGTIACEHVVIGAGPWVRDFWTMLDLPKRITVKTPKGEVHEDVDMWRFWQLEEGVLQVPPVIHVDTDAPLSFRGGRQPGHRRDVGHLLQARLAFRRHPGRRRTLQNRNAGRRCRHRSLRPVESGVRFQPRLRPYVGVGAGSLSQPLRRHHAEIPPGTVWRHRLFHA